MSIYAVNGKEPIVALIPSLDTAGNGTTTLTDLTGNGYNGTLTNMNPATAWPADTGAGGVRALELDGVTNWIALNGTFALTTAISFSCWLRLSASGSDPRILERDIIGGADDFSFSLNGAARTPRTSVDTRAATTATALVINAWEHLVFVANDTNISIYRNGSLITSTTVAAINMTGGVGSMRIGRSHVNGNYLSGRIDDLRVFNQGLDASDVAYLYNSGNGRGRIAAAATGRGMVINSNRLINSNLLVRAGW